MLVSVIIPVYRDWERLVRCLSAIQRQSLSAGEFEIIVANNEPEATAPSLVLPANARMVHIPKPGSYAARNGAVAVSRGQFLAFTDSDCVPEPDWLRSGVSLLEAYPGSQATGPIKLFREPMSSYVAFLYEAHTVLNQDKFVAQGYCATANLLVERRTFDLVGPFDDDRLSGGDLEWGFRARLAGIGIVYDAAVAVGHPARPSIGQVLRRKRRFAGDAALRADDDTWRYVMARLRWPSLKWLSTRSSSSRAPAKVSRRDAIILFFIQWLVRWNEAGEFLLVRMGIKGPNRA